MHVLVINEKSSDNIGDQAICEAMSSSIRSFGHNVSTYDFSFRNQVKVIPKQRNQYQQAVNLSEIKRKNIVSYILRKIKYFAKTILRIFSALKIIDTRYSLVIIGGGQLILDNNNFSSAMLAWIIACKIRRVKVHIFAVGVGDSFLYFDKLIFRWCLSQAKVVAVRDPLSQNNLREKINFYKAALVPDCVYGLSNTMQPKDKKIKYKQALIAPVEYSVHSRYCSELGVQKKTESEYLLYWKDIFKEHCKIYEKIVVTATTGSDYIFALSITKLCREEGIIVEVISSQSWQQYLDLASSSDVIVSGRMHALILGEVAGSAVVPIILSSKLKSYKDSLRWGNAYEKKVEFYNELSKILKS